MRVATSHHGDDLGVQIYEIGIVYRFEAEDSGHAIEQFLDVVVHPDRRHTEIDSDIESAINQIKTI